MTINQTVFGVNSAAGDSRSWTWTASSAVMALMLVKMVEWCL